MRSVWLFATLCTVTHQTPLSMGLSMQEYWSGLPFLPPGDLPDPAKDQIHISCAFCIADGFFAAEPSGKTISQSLLKFMSIEPLMLSKHLILCCSLLLLPSIFPSFRVFSTQLALHIRWPKYWNFSFSNSSSNEYSGLIYFRINWELTIHFE